MAQERLRVRLLTDEERVTLERWAASEKGEVRLHRRARILLHSSGGWWGSHLVTMFGVTDATGRRWIKRFNAHGLDGIRDGPRAGRPPTYTPEQVAEVLAAALTDPRTLGLPFACWTLDRLATYLNEQRGIPIERTRTDELLLREGLRWHAPETWCGERVDPPFAEQRGKSSGSAPRHPAAA